MYDTKINRYNDKTLPPHGYITKELVRRKVVSNDDFELYLYDYLFEELLIRYEFKTIIVATNYIITKLKQSDYFDSNGNKIENLYSYIRTSLYFDLKKITGEIYLDYFNDS